MVIGDQTVKAVSREAERSKIVEEQADLMWQSAKWGSLRWYRLFWLTIGVPGKQKPTFRDSWGMANLDFYSLSLGLPYGGPLNTPGKLPKSNSFRKSPKLTGFTQTLPPQEYVNSKDCTLSDKQRPAKPPTRNKDQQSCLEEAYTNWGSWKEHSILVGLPASCAVCSWLIAYTSCHRVDFGNASVFESCLLLQATPHLYFCK